MMEGQGLANPACGDGPFPGCSAADVPGRRGDGNARQATPTAAAFYHRELEIKVKHFTSLFEPAIIIFMGVIVGFVAVALVSAMYGIYRQVNVT